MRRIPTVPSSRAAAYDLTRRNRAGTRKVAQAIREQALTEFNLQYGGRWIEILATEQPEEPWDAWQEEESR